MLNSTLRRKHTKAKITLIVAAYNVIGKFAEVYTLVHLEKLKLKER